MLLFGIVLEAQDSNKAIGYAQGKNDTSFGVTVGHALFVKSLEVSIHNTSRISSSSTIELKAQAGLVNDTGVVSESRIDKYFYAGLSPVFLFGKHSNLFEISIGGAYLKRRTEADVGKPNRFIPTGVLGCRRVFNNHSLRLGIGVPNGCYLGFTF